MGGSPRPWGVSSQANLLPCKEPEQGSFSVRTHPKAVSMRNDAPVSTQAAQTDSRTEGAYAQIAQVRTERVSRRPGFCVRQPRATARLVRVRSLGWTSATLVGAHFARDLLRRRRARKHLGLLAFLGWTSHQGAGWSTVVVPLRTGSYQAGTREVQTDSGVGISARALLTFDGVQPRAPTAMC